MENKTENGFAGCISEEKYEEMMERTVEPYLGKIVEAGYENGLYYEFYRQLECKATIVICYGYTESCVKYHELIYYMHQMGYQVIIWDVRGHGKSLRETDDLKMVHIGDFSQYVSDMHHMIQKIAVPKSQGKPLYLYAHSMGGCISTLYLEEYPGVIAKAVLNAPMLGINNGNIPDFAALLLCDLAILFGKRREKLFTMGDFDPMEPFETSGCDSRARHSYYRSIRATHEEYQNSYASYSWARAAVRAARKAVAPKNAAKIRIPVLLFQAERDAFVRNKEQDQFLSHITDGHKVIVDSRHEISRNINEQLEPYLKEVFAFYDQIG